MRKARAVEVSPGRIVRSFTEAEAADLAGQWMAVYGTRSRGVNADAFMWHVFSSERHPNVGADEAWRLYRREDAIEFIVLCNDRKQAFVTDVRPEACSWDDCCVFPPNLAWTMARTHEEGWLGPYFARHPRHVELDEENAAALRKRREKAEAHARGWWR